MVGVVAPGRQREPVDPGRTMPLQMDVVILAGGGGTRLHPLSTPERPKPFLPLLPGPSLFRRTVDRLLADGALGIGPADITVVAARPFGALAADQAPPGVTVVEEPIGRNTAAAIALAVVAVERDPDDVMVVLPADHAIGDEVEFRRVIAAVAGGIARGFGAQDSPLVTLGIRPDHPATGYGYLVPDPTTRAIAGGVSAARIDAFVEKPDATRAAALLAERPGVAWNAGIFLWRRRAIRAALERYAPDVVETIAAGVARGDLGRAYAAVRATSIDFAVMEPAARDGVVVMADMDVGWSDLGGWTSLLGALGAAGEGRVVAAGEPAEAGPGDLVVRRVDGRLVVEAGPSGGILDADGPTAILAGAARDRPLVDALIARCQPSEIRP